MPSMTLDKHILTFVLVVRKMAGDYEVVAAGGRGVGRVGGIVTSLLTLAIGSPKKIKVEDKDNFYETQPSPLLLGDIKTFFTGESPPPSRARP